MNKLNVHVDNLREMGERFANAWERVEAGETVQERHVTFFSWEELTKILTPKRLEILRYLHRDGSESIRSLTVSLDRDYKRIHEDVMALEAAGFIVRDGTRLSVPWDTLATEVTL